jgi:PTS system N-acetylglucosamine-specific IIC component
MAQRFSLSALQPLGRALMLPIAVLPVAGLMLRLGQSDIHDLLVHFGLPAVASVVPFIGAAGNAIFHNLGLLFAIGVAVGFAKDGNGAAGLAGVVCFIVATNGAEALMTAPADALAGFAGKARDLADAAWRADAINRLSVPLGILSGVLAGWAYNRFGSIKLPDYLAFFGGRRFVPILSGLIGLGLAAAFGFGFGALSSGIDTLSRAIVAAGPFGLFIYGALNRLLIVTGLHHILNNVAWFIIGDYHGATGDLNRFFAGDPTAGAFMAGYFPVMMFGLPAACLAMYHTAKPERRSEVGGMLFSLALTAILTGVTEPIEFSFMFLAPVLFGLHAVLTGLAMVLMDALHVRLGFSFSAGLFDYLINFGKATRPLLLIPVGIFYFGLYYGVFRFAIQRWDLKTPGRESDEDIVAAPIVTGELGRARGYIAALGGAANLVSIDACTTRLRLVVKDQSVVDAPTLKALGARGLVKPSDHDLQVVVGPIADEVAREMRQAMGSPVQTEPAPVAAIAQVVVSGEHRSLAASLLAALGGATNLNSAEPAANRILVSLTDPARIDGAALTALGVRGVAVSGDRSAHLVLAGAAAGPAQALADLIKV